MGQKTIAWYTFLNRIDHGEKERMAMTILPSVSVALGMLGILAIINMVVWFLL